jgi:hypothetical protein
VAENMLGVAMYELVRQLPPSLDQKLTITRSMSDMITLLAKSFESMRIELRFRFTRRQVGYIGVES